MNHKQYVLAIVVAVILVGCKCKKHNDVTPYQPSVDPVASAQVEGIQGTDASTVKCINGELVNISVANNVIQTQPVLDEYNNMVKCN